MFLKKLQNMKNLKNMLGIWILALSGTTKCRPVPPCRMFLKFCFKKRFEANFQELYLVSGALGTLRGRFGTDYFVDQVVMTLKVFVICRIEY